jgi:ribosomal-protein-alanine N-acetyltransferase
MNIIKRFIGLDGTEQEAKRSTPAGIRSVFRNIPALHTKRLLLRKIEPSDSDDMYEYSCQELVTRYLLWYPHPSKEFTESYIDRLQDEYREGSFFDWGVVLPDFNGREKLIGTCGFTELDPGNNRGEIGYVLNPRFWGQGYAVEAASRVIRFGFEQLSLNRIDARYMVENEHSAYVMESCSMKFEGIRRQAMYVKGRYRDIGEYSILKSDFSANI